MNIKEKLEEIDNQIQELNNKKFELIINNKELNKLEKLECLSNSNIFSPEIYIKRVFSKLEEKWEKELKIQYPDETYFRINDIFIIYRDKYERINLYEQLENLIENCYDNEKVDILFCTVGNYSKKEKLTYKMKLQNVIDYVYDWCIENECIEFNMDW